MLLSICDFVVDEDYDGCIDLCNLLLDIFVSVVNYFVGYGWVCGGLVVMWVQFDSVVILIMVKDSKLQWLLEQFEVWGYVLLVLVNFGELSSLQMFDGVIGLEYWFIFQNFYVIIIYNCSLFYVMVVYQLVQVIDVGVQQVDVM